MMKRLVYLLLPLICGSLCVLSCGGKDASKEKGEKSVEQNKENSLQLNITFLLDLSDRIDTVKYPAYPQHYKRDIEVIKTFVQFFKKDMEKRGAFKAKGKMRVIFSPAPQDAAINRIVENLNIDLEPIDWKNTKEKKEIYKKIDETFEQNLTDVYNQTIVQGNFIGADIWRFFQYDVKDYCIAQNSEKYSYRNILVILTDGYLFHVNSKDKVGNRTAYISPNNIEQWGLRQSNWKQRFDTEDFGFITHRNDLQDLEILVLEITPAEKHQHDGDVMRAYFDKWFKEMNVKYYEIHNSDLPSHTKMRIDKFLGR